MAVGAHDDEIHLFLPGQLGDGLVSLPLEDHSVNVEIQGPSAPLDFGHVILTAAYHRIADA
jgi:hypothetical protein